MKIKSHIGVLKDFFLGGFRHKDLVKLELLEASLSLDVDAVFIRGLAHRVVTLQLNIIPVVVMLLQAFKTRKYTYSI